MGCILIEYSKILHSSVMMEKAANDADEIAAVTLKHNVMWCIKYIWQSRENFFISNMFYFYSNQLRFDFVFMRL